MHCRSCLLCGMCCMVANATCVMQPEILEPAAEDSVPVIKEEVNFAQLLYATAHP